LDSALSIALGGTVKYLDGFAVPYSHTELGSAATTWILDRHILPFFRGQDFPRRCPNFVDCEKNGTTCLEGVGLTKQGTCTIPLEGLFSGNGVTVAWTSWLAADGPTATIAPHYESCPRVDVTLPAVYQGFYIYRSTQPFADGMNAERLAFVDGATTIYFDASGGPQYYYAVAPISSGHEAWVSRCMRAVAPPRRRAGGK